MKPSYRKFEELLKRAGMKPADIAKATGIAPSTLSDWKHGDYYPKVDKLYLIAKALVVTIEDLLE